MDLDSQLATLQLGATITLARQNAVKAAVKLLIGHHPDRERLAAQWDSLIPELVDHMQDKYQNNDTYQKAFRDALAEFSGIFRAQPRSD